MRVGPVKGPGAPPGCPPLSYFRESGISAIVSLPLWSNMTIARCVRSRQAISEGRQEAPVPRCRGKLDKGSFPRPSKVHGLRRHARCRAGHLAQRNHFRVAAVLVEEPTTVRGVARVRVTSSFCRLTVRAGIRGRSWVTCRLRRWTW